MIEMSRGAIRFMALTVCSSAVAGTMGGWIATGGLAFSRSPTSPVEETAQSEPVSVSGEADAEVADDPFAIFEETGVNEGFEEIESVEEVFAIGMLPGGPRDPISVASVAGAAGAAMVLVLVMTRRK